ncbi:MAG: hypothetical protein EA398_11775 [Deltaproteobacteria bacterium]|nr:MAG: hypothetical protein EA398_11775 [Deltaproteobacteria bacterium]
MHGPRIHRGRCLGPCGAGHVSAPSGVARTGTARGVGRGPCWTGHRERRTMGAVRGDGKSSGERTMVTAARKRFEVRLHGALWKSAEKLRRQEWTQALGEINGTEHDAVDLGIEFVRPPGCPWQVRIYRDGTELIDTVEPDVRELERCISEYGATIRQLVQVDRNAPVRGVEALDYAKRVVHDEAASILREALEGHIVLTLDEARKLFTVLFLAASDLPGEFIRYHRFH